MRIGSTAFGFIIICCLLVTTNSTITCNVEGCSQCKGGDPNWCETCGDGFLRSASNSKMCSTCPDGCKTCELRYNRNGGSYDWCLSCFSNYTYVDGTCKEKCSTFADCNSKNDWSKNRDICNLAKAGGVCEQCSSDS